MRVLLVAITDGQCSLEFAVSMLQLQVATRSTPQVELHVGIASSLRDALDAVAKAPGEIDALVALQSDITFPASFVLQGLAAPSPFVVGVFPLPTIDWDRVVSKAGSRAEELRFAGNVYNVDASLGKPAANGYMEVPRAKLGAVVLRGPALKALAESAACTDEALCAAWGKGVHADLNNPCALTGPCAFSGCVGARAVAC